MRPLLSDILQATLNRLRIPYDEWETMNSFRVSRTIKVKQLLSLIAHEQGYKHIEIAEFLRTHRTTVIYHIKSAEDLCSVYEKYRDDADAIREICNSDRQYQLSHVSQAWIARTRTGLLIISPNKFTDYAGWWMAEDAKPFYPQDSFPQVTYDSGPVKVNIKVTINNNEKM